VGSGRRGGAREPAPGLDGASMSGAGWWLRLQFGLALGGGVIWLGGAFSESDFFAGLGAGLLIAALTLRLGRRAAGYRAPRRGADLGRDEAEDP